MKHRQATRQALFSSIYIGLLFGVIWWMSANVVWLGDDLDYKYMMRGEIWQSWGRIKSVKAFFESQYIHYTHVNGRFVAHSIVQLFNAYLGQQVFAIFNAIAYSMFAFMIGRVALVKFCHNSRGMLSVVCIAVLCFVTKMMPTCQIGYIWGMLANICWLSFFFKYSKPTWIFTIILMLLGIIVGNWQESISIGVCCGLGLWWILQLSHSWKNPQCQFDWRRSWMFAGYVTGTASNCLAPSTIGRISNEIMPLSDQLLIASYSFPAILLFLLAIILFKTPAGIRKLFSFKDEYSNIPSGVLISAMFALIIFNVAISIYSNRQLFGANLFAAILTIRILPKHRFNRLVSVIASIAVVAFWTVMAIGISEVKRQYIEISRIHATSSDGSVRFNRKRVTTLGFPLRSKYYEDILGQFDNDIHHSLMKDFKLTRKGKTLKLKPSSIVDFENVEQYAPGHFNVTIKEPLKGETLRKVVVYGHYPILGLKTSPRLIEVTKYSSRRPPYATAVIIPEFPFFTADSVIILPHDHQ